jgi:hypothetical protein
VTSKKITGNVRRRRHEMRRPHADDALRGAVARERARHMKMTGGNGPSEVTITGKWVAAACKE